MVALSVLSGMQYDDSAIALPSSSHLWVKIAFMLLKKEWHMSISLGDPQMLGFFLKMMYLNLPQ